MNAVQAREVRAQIDRIARSELFAESERLCRFLRFTTESALSGEGNALKEYVVGRQVFDRDGEYDPRLDPIVRVEARRLRAKLTRYYDGPGSADAIRIEYPKGGYAPVFRRADPQTRTTNVRRTAWVTALAAATVLTLAGAIALRTGAAGSGDVVAVLPVQWVFSDRGEADRRAIPIAEALTIELANRRIAPVVAWPLVSERPKPGTPIKALAAEYGASELLVVMVRDDLGGATLFAIDPSTGRKLHAFRYSTPVLSSAEQQHLAQRMASDYAAVSRLMKR